MPLLRGMTALTSLQLNLQTGDLSGAGTDGDVYLGFAGREFSIDTSADDFERNGARTYRFGDGSNILNAAVNDPREPALELEKVARFPVYVRFQPQSRTDNWLLARATVTVNGGLFPMWDTAEHFSQRVGLWLGVRSGLVAHLLLHEDVPTG